MEVNFENTQFLEGRVATRQSRIAFAVQVGGGVIDVLHCVDAGVGAHIVGNIMMLCIVIALLSRL